MRSSYWAVITFLAIGAVSTAVWYEQKIQRQTGNQAIDASSVKNDRAVLQLNGVVVPTITDPIAEPLDALSVPVGSRVAKGQVIGHSASRFATRQENRAEQVQFDNPEVRVTEAQKELKAAEAKLAVARAGRTGLENKSLSAESAELRQAGEYQREDRSFRQGTMSDLRHDQAVQDHDSAHSAVAAAEDNVAADRGDLSGLEARVAEARRTLNRARNRQPAANSELQTSSTGAPWVAAPADGTIVAIDRAAGTFGIAADPGRFTAITAVPAANIGAVRVGQSAVVLAGRDPEIRVDAKVSDIAEEPSWSADGLVYQVKLNLNRPAAFPLDGVSVKIQLQASGN